ncbi:transferase family-domain-containing protein [Fomitopsis serialis]|uniref:transferase family-domain-containing protein n=1 Tax=Fomitopsis serialis TaxID=139415 RepID=UPI002007FE85|nr:transferase family-domain-containing protein [Neoantrodia serialis]KAH9926114.1 transferase family-domain-containing protein [Neoantrodia serialis]
MPNGTGADSFRGSIIRVSQSRIFPQQRTAKRTSVPLSVADCSVVRFTTAAAVWYFDAPEGERATKALSPDQLRLSLETTLSCYPQLVGQLHWATHVHNGNHTQRAGRLVLTYVAKSPVPLRALVPSASERRRDGYWDATQLASDALLHRHLYRSHLEEHAGLPGLMIQITTFACGADAQTVARFSHDWAATNRAMVLGLALPELLKKSRALPMHRYDWWATTDDSTPSVPAPLKAAAEVPAAAPIPWSEWNVQAPVSHYIIHFTPGEMQRMWKAAQPAASTQGHTVSRHDALLAHVWALANRARGLAEDDQPVHMNVTLGLRDRVSPVLPDSFLGSPIILGRLEVAAGIRSVVNLFDTETVAALLHDMAHDLALARIWHAFLGRRNFIVTSWVRLGLYDADFGTGTRARYVEAVMPSCDGCLQVMEAVPVDHEYAGAGDDEEGGRRKRWYDDGVDVSLHLAADAMEKLMKDPLLRKYRVP